MIGIIARHPGRTAGSVSGRRIVIINLPPMYMVDDSWLGFCSVLLCC